MKKKLRYTILFTGLFLFFVNSRVNAQLSSGDSFIALKTGILNLNNYTQRNIVGIELDFMVTDNIGIHYNFLAGRKFFHGPAAPIGGSIVMTTLLTGGGDAAGAFVIGLLLCAIPEGVSFNANISPSFSLSAMISPLEFDFIRNDNQQYGTDSFIGGSAGLKFNYLFYDKKIRISPFGVYKLHYHRNNNHGIFGGIAVGYNLSPQVDESHEFIIE